MADVEKIRGSYKGGNLQVIELDPSAVPPEGDSDKRVAMQARAAEINRLGITSWTQKFHDMGGGKAPLMWPKAIQEVWGTSERQLERILKPTQAARYLLALESKPEGTAEAVGFTRVESYSPSGRLAKAVRAASRAKYPYPNVSGLELNRQYHHYGDAAAALLYHALDVDEFDPTHKVSAYSEEPDEFCKGFYELQGFEEVRTVKAENLPFDYVHLEAPSIEYVLDNLRDQYLFLRHWGQQSQ